MMMRMTKWWLADERREENRRNLRRHRVVGPGHRSFIIFFFFFVFHGPVIIIFFRHYSSHFNSFCIVGTLITIPLFPLFLLWHEVTINAPSSTLAQYPEIRYSSSLISLLSGSNPSQPLYNRLHLSPHLSLVKKPKSSLFYRAKSSSLSTISIMIMSFCKKGLHSFLGFTSFVDSSPPLPPPPASKANALPSGVVGLSTATGDSPRGPNVLESTAVIPPPPPTKKDPGGFIGFGFVDEVGGGVVDGLMSCTESLGFESSDDLSADEWYPTRPVKPVERTRWREASERRRERKFPPPISSLNHKGQPSFFLRSVRTEGRLELTEVRIDRPEILRASREDGRLRLELIVDEDKEIEEQEQEKEPELIPAADDEEAGGGEERDEVGEWKKIAVSGGEGFGRCHEAVNHQSFRHHHGHHHHHHNLHDVWRQPCVPTR